MTCFKYLFTSSLFLTGQLSSFEMCAVLLVIFIVTRKHIVTTYATISFSNWGLLHGVNHFE